MAGWKDVYAVRSLQQTQQVATVSTAVKSRIKCRLEYRLYKPRDAPQNAPFQGNPHTIHGSLNPSENTFQKESQLVQSFSTAHGHDQHTQITLRL